MDTNDIEVCYEVSLEFKNTPDGTLPTFTISWELPGLLFDPNLLSKTFFIRATKVGDDGIFVVTRESQSNREEMTVEDFLALREGQAVSWTPDYFFSMPTTSNEIDTFTSRYLINRRWAIVMRKNDDEEEMHIFLQAHIVTDVVVIDHPALLQ